MREILFRGKQIDNGEWVYGVPVKATSIDESEMLIIKSVFDCEEYACRGCDFEPVVLESIGEFTGLTDKNGKKIFEGDYWIDTDDGENDIFVVEFRNGQFCFVIYGICGALMPYGYDETAGGFGECDCVPMTDFYVDKIEIIGNIHDNPELLKGETNA